MFLQAPPAEVIAPVVVSIALFVSTAAVLIFRPLTKRLGDRLAATKQPTIIRADEAELASMHQALEETNARVEQLEQRLDFTERLLAKPRDTAMLPGQSVPPQAEQPPRTS
jgi:hypothetical protein